MTIRRTTATVLTPPGRGGIAVIRLEGPLAGKILAGAFRPYKGHLRGGDGVLQLGLISDGQNTIDEAVICSRRGGTEINIHGGPAAAKSVMERLVALGAEAMPARAAREADFNPAHPKWQNPAIGLEMLEALPLVRSRLALAAITSQWSDGLSRLAREVLAAGGPPNEAAEKLLEASDGLAVMHKLLHPPEVVLAGRPNTGKSTLANAMVGREMSLVHHTAGTTRDWIREPALIDGVPIWLTDTAGIYADGNARQSPPPAGDVDAEAVRRALSRAAGADLVVMLHVEPESAPVAADIPGRVLRVASKCDVAKPRGRYDAAISAVTGDGMADLRRAILEKLGLAGIAPAIPRAFTRRQSDLLKSAAGPLACGESDKAAGLLRLLLGER